MAALAEGRNPAGSASALSLLAETQRLLGDDAAARPPRPAPRRSRSSSAIGCWPRAAHLTLARLAAAREDWTAAQQHALAHLDACAQGGHLTWVPGCLDALGEIAAGLGVHEDAVRLFAAAAARPPDMGVARVIPEKRALGRDRRAPARGPRRPPTTTARRPGRRADDRRRARMGPPHARPTHAPRRGLAIADADRGQGRRARRRRAHQPPDRRADVHLARDGQDPPRARLHQARRQQPRRTRGARRPPRHRTTRDARSEISPTWGMFSLPSGCIVA